MTAGAIHIDAMLDDPPLDRPRTSVIRRLDALAEMQIIVRRDTRGHLNELVWQRRTNLWRRVTNPARTAKRLTSRTARSVEHEDSEGAGRNQRRRRPSIEIPARQMRSVADSTETEVAHVLRGLACRGLVLVGVY